MTDAAHKRIRERQDLHTVPDFEREMNDIAAADLYEQTLLECIRSGTNPNAKAEIVVYEGYVEPTFDAERGRELLRKHRESTAAILKEREEIIKALHASPKHMALSDFDRLLIETEYYTGLREWNGVDEENPRKGGSSRLTRHHREENENSMDFEMNRLTETPSFIKGKLRPYQLEGVNWLLDLFSRNINGILADEMGLGKTFQTIATIAFLKFGMGIPGPHLVVCPKSVMGNWFREFRQWCPALSVYKFHAASDIRKAIVKSHLQPHDNLKYDVIVTTFEMILDEFNAFQKIQWQYLIVDEAHKLKNEQSRAHMALDSLHTSHRIIITGTPLQNNLKELWALLHFLAPKLFKDAEVFDAWFDTNAGQQDENVMENLHKILSPMMLRRLKADVNTGIPPKKEIYVSCKLTKKQREWYLQVLTNDAEALNKASGGNISSLSNILMQLRKVINHPYLMQGAEEGPPFITDEKIINVSGKMIILDKLLHRLRQDKEGNHKVLIFSQFTTMLDIIEDYCNYRGIKYCRIDGNTSGYFRDSQMAAFNAPNSEYFVFLLSTRAGGLGINLQAANHVILYDSDWNPQMDLQAQDRAHRIGQKRSVRVYRFVTDQTVEERIYRRALKKLYLDAVVVQQGRIQSKAANQVSKEEMLSMIKFGAEEIFKSRHEDVTEADIDQLLDAGEAKLGLLANEAKQQIQASLASFELGAEEANLYDFEGISFRDGEKTRTLHLSLKEPISQEDLKAECEKFGDVTKVVLHPNLKEALVHYRSVASAIEAQPQLPFESVFASKDATAIVNADMLSEVIGERKLGRGHRVRETVQFYTPQEVRSDPKTPNIRLPAVPRYPSYQLFNIKRLTELHNLEVAIKIEKWKQKRSRKETKVEGEEGSEENEEKEEDDDNNGEANEGDLPLVEREERERLLKEGFPNWTATEYRAVISALTTMGLDEDDYTGIAAVVGPTKTPQEVKDYLLAFFDRGERCVKGYDRILSRITKVRERRRERERRLQAARWKVESCDNPETQLTFKMTKGGSISSLDRKLFLMAYKTNFSDESIGSHFQMLPENKFNVWCQSRHESFFEKRLHSLLNSAKREWEALQGNGDDRPISRRRLE